MKSLQFTREQEDGATETLSIVRSDEPDDCLYVQVEAGTPDDLGDYVGLYTLTGDQVRHTVGAWSLVPGDRIPAGEDADDVADTLAAEAERMAGGTFTRADYLDADGSLPFAAILADWESGASVVRAWGTQEMAS